MMFEPGSLVTCRDREWVVQPGSSAAMLQILPLGGSPAEACTVIPELDPVSPASFPLPSVDQIGDFQSAAILRDAARLSLRRGAGPFRSFARINVRPRPYQLVPLLMALGLNPVRLLIADDVGIGKTIEAGLIVSELLDRGEISCFTVLCPPHLCDQWQVELETKFGISAKVIRSGTLPALERQMEREGASSDQSVFSYFPFTITSIDFVKGERHRASFKNHCPPMVIVDEVHAAARSNSRRSQQRYALVRALADEPTRHMILLSATPHSGVEDAFRSILGLLDRSFEGLNLTNLPTPDRKILARHFVQRRRSDITNWLNEETPFPDRENRDITYDLAASPAYRRLFNQVYDVARELIQDSPAQANRQRVRYWAALALLRCVMSSPAAAAKALSARADAASLPQEVLDQNDQLAGSIHDYTNPDPDDDVEPTALIGESVAESLTTAKLRDLAKQAEALQGAGDPKLAALVPVIRELLDDGFHPIVFCRYIATAHYVAKELERQLRSVRAVAVTGDYAEDQREEAIRELAKEPKRVLVATDCLSEGINLQHAFNAVIHYDLPWNPNRLEQRQGRIDRYGQPEPKVRIGLLYGHNNPIDDAVIKVLLEKAFTIHRDLGITIPLPLNNEDVVNALISRLFRPAATQLSLLDTEAAARFDAAEALLAKVETQWAEAEEQERRSRSIFAQHSIPIEQVTVELQATEHILGTVDTVRNFVRGACERLGAPLSPIDRPALDRWSLPVAALPPTLRALAPAIVTFDGPAPEGVTALTRNHPFTAELAATILAAATSPYAPIAFPRAAVIRGPVPYRTIFALLRIRTLITSPNAPHALAEELATLALFRDKGEWTALDAHDSLTSHDTSAALHTNGPAAFVSEADRRHHIEQALATLTEHHHLLQDFAVKRATALEGAHRRVRTGHGVRATQGVRVHAPAPPDVLGVYVILPSR